MKARDIMTHPARIVRGLHAGVCGPDSEGKLVGILAESDFAGKEKGGPFPLYRFPQVFGDRLPNQGVEKMYAAARSRRVGEFMSRAVATVDIADDIEAVIARMRKTGFHRLPVVVDGQPDGVIARHDLLRLMQVRMAEGERT